MPPSYAFLQPVFDNIAFRSALDALQSGVPAAVALSGLTGTGKALVVAGLAHKIQRPAVVLTTDNESAEALAKAARTFLTWLEPAAHSTIHVLPAPDCSPYENRSPHPEISERRAVALWHTACGRTRILFAPLAAALGRFRESHYYRSLALELDLGDEVSLDDLVEHLTAVGYESGEPVTTPAQFSVRGGIVDLFPPEVECPLRLEFFGNRIESIREYDPGTQRSRKAAASVTLLPFCENRRSPGLFSRLVQTLTARVPHLRGEPEWAAEYSGQFPGWEFFVPLVEPAHGTLLTLFARPLLIWDEPIERRTQFKKTLESLHSAYDEVRDVVPPRPRPEDIFLTESEFDKMLEGAPGLALEELAIEDGGTAAESAPGAFLLASQPPPKFHGAVKSLVEDLNARRARAETAVVVLPTAGKADRLREILAEYEIPYTSDEETPAHHSARDASPEVSSSTRPENPTGPAAPAVLIARGELDEGIIFPDLKLALLSDSDLFGESAWGTRGRRERSVATTFISDLSDLKVGDYVVHIDHGVALYQGLRPLVVEGASRDFMLLTFQEEAKLYVPLERLDLVEKFRAAGDGAKPALDRLGGTTWARTKSRVKRSLRDIAQELLRLYAERKMHPGTAYSADTPWQRELEDSFPFEETPDQISAMTDIKRDLESPQPMDRLLCGDVGYGKTELAMRAAFKVVQDGRQVVLLAPTTVLAFQHYATFRQRFAPFPVRIEMLSRFRSPAEQKRIVAETEAGRVDILIGTHRLLSKDVRLRDLGLLVVDEEQRFGVAAKEKLKKLRASVDVLTLSATPIPRTLHMSLGGLRDLSIIETPPRGRLAIQTVVAPFADSLIQSAILQEMARQGQVFFVHNRVETIWSIAALVGRLVPSARLGVSHGQMGEKDLERVMLKFMEGGYDVLVSTALIENGLDIPRANTIIVNRADRFGLSELYQLRGRVGRSNRRAYAYFLIPAEDTLSPIAKRRLAALKEFSDLGAGFRLAALDLELRGAGNVLGAEQSGHLNAIGIDLYLKMLEQTVDELRGAPPRVEIRTTLSLGLDIKIPETYIADESQRLRMYKRISALSTAEQLAEMQAELLDRYGAVPPPVARLQKYALLKAAAEQLLVQSIEKKAEEVRLKFHAEAPLDPAKVTGFVRRHRGASLRPDGTLRFRLAAPEGEIFELLQNVLRELAPQH